MGKSYYEYLCNNLESVENYEKAEKDDFKGWHCHHRLETHNSDGERRLVDLSYKELKALDMYYHRPAEELIFMTVAEHTRLHKKGKQPSEEARKKISVANKGKTMSEEYKAKISAAMKGRTFSEETRKKLSAAMKGKSPSNKGKHCKLVDGKRVYY